MHLDDIGRSTIRRKIINSLEALYVTEEQYEDGMAIVIRLWPY